MKLFSIVNASKCKYIKILGITLYRKKIFHDVMKREVLYGLISSVATQNSKDYKIMGIKIYSSKNKYLQIKNEIISAVDYIIKKRLSTYCLHQKTFLPFKNKHRGESVVLVGAGPSVLQYIPLKKTYHLGLNRAFKFDKVHFDYLFAIDQSGICEYYDEFASYPNCTKFVGDQDNGPNFQIPESYALSMDCLRYKTSVHLPSGRFAFDIDTEPLGNFCSVSLQAAQFLLYTNPKKIYLVGIDCNLATGGHFVGGVYDISSRGESLSVNDSRSINDWKNLKNFAETYYPDTEIISINPVGLKGVFKDIYTNENGEYVDENGIILENVELSNMQKI